MEVVGLGGDAEEALEAFAHTGWLQSEGSVYHVHHYTNMYKLRVLFTNPLSLTGKALEYVLINVKF